MGRQTNHHPLFRRKHLIQQPLRPERLLPAALLEVLRPQPVVLRKRPLEPEPRKAPGKRRPIRPAVARVQADRLAQVLLEGRAEGGRGEVEVGGPGEVEG